MVTLACLGVRAVYVHRRLEKHMSPAFVRRGRED